MDEKCTLRRAVWKRNYCLVVGAFMLILGLAGPSEALTVHDGEKFDGEHYLFLPRNRMKIKGK